jgi:hypothetical protein
MVAKIINWLHKYMLFKPVKSVLYVLLFYCVFCLLGMEVRLEGFEIIFKTP